ncbi:MAG: ABC transporter ATP-binding protein [Actinomycetota bacterium]|nr:ABC transporter ATP-binding protein [Actinomycetota bacterium]
MSESILECSALEKSYDGRKVVDGVGFTIGKGESYGLLGPNGAGKTTTISMICGLLRRDGGQVTVAGNTLDTTSAQSKKAIGYVPQDIALYPDLSGKENLRFWGRLYGLSGKDLSNAVSQTLEIVGLSERASDRVSEYSGGMKRRLNIAAGLLHKPKLLILDEPTVGVDPQSRNAILENVEALNQQGMSVLYTSHYMEEVERLCHRVGIIDEGKLIAEGTRRELVHSIGQKDRIKIAATGDLDALARECKAMEQVAEATVAQEVHLIAADGRLLLPQIFAAAERTGVSISTVDVIEPDLEAVFLHLTGKALRD